MAIPMLVALLLVACSGLAAANFRCPPAPVLGPYCTCRELHSFSNVRCSKLDSMELLGKALKHKFGSCPIPWLRIADSTLPSIPASAFANVSFERLVVNGSRLASVDPDAFEGTSEAVRFVVLQDGELSEVPSSALSKLTRLETLSLSGNSLTSLSKQDFAGNPGLLHLILSRNRISRVDSDTFPSEIRTLGLSGNRLTTLNDSVLHLQRLEWLLLSGNRLTDIHDQLVGLPHLQLLNLDGNLLGDVEDDSFLELKDLHVLNLAYNGIQHLGAAFHPLVQMRYLNLSNNHLTRLEEDGFANLTKLQGLDLSGNRLNVLGAAMEPLRGLVSLNLSHNNLISLSHVELQWLRSLRDLDVSHNQLMALDDHFGQDLSKMVSLILADNHLESLHGCLKHLRDLQELDLRFNHLTSLDKHDIPSNGRLHLVRLAGNPWVCDGMLTHTLHDLDTRLISVEGRPVCGLPPPDGL